MEEKEPNHFDYFNHLLYGTGNKLISGYTDTSYLWRIVEIPLVLIPLSEVTVTRSNNASIQAAIDDQLHSQYKFKDFDKSETAYNVLFQGCIPTGIEASFYFSGTFKNSTGRYIRVGSLNIDSHSLESAYEAGSPDLDEDGATGFLTCGQDADGQDQAIIFIQNYQDL
mmetsp:Transcript_14547/g.14165  ORF Transcript_14547/g.14165 Transcript_14547/m.14165 type:complete len:168 (-) Transcript_14547:1893-2396(-)